MAKRNTSARTDGWVQFDPHFDYQTPGERRQRGSIVPTVAFWMAAFIITGLVITNLGMKAGIIDAPAASAEERTQITETAVVEVRDDVHLGADTRLGVHEIMADHRDILAAEAGGN